MKGYTSKAKIEKYMMIDIDAQFDTQVNEWIETAEAIIDKETGRDFTPVAGTPVATDRKYDGNGKNELRLDPNIEVVSVKLSTDGDVIDTDQFVVYPAVGTPKTKIVMPYQKFPEGYQNIVVNAKYGYATVPRDIEFAASVIVAGIINESWDSSGEVSSLTIGSYSVSYKTGSKQEEDFSGLSGIFDRNRKY